MFHPAPLMPDDVSPLEANLDRMYWSSLLSGRMMPGLGLAASRMRTPRERGEVASVSAPEGVAKSQQRKTADSRR